METLESEQFVNIINNGYVAISTPNEDAIKEPLKRKRRTSNLEHNPQD